MIPVKGSPGQGPNRSKIMKRYEGKTVIVTGASKGIGRGIAKVFALEGANVLVVSRNSDDGEKVVNEILEADGKASYFSADVSKWKDMETMAKTAMDRYGKIDVLCANAGIFPSATIEEMTEDNWNLVNDVNLKGTFLAVKACLPMMKEKKYGKIILTSSITGPTTGYPGWSHYGASKAGMLGFMRTACLETAKHNITMNAILPGNIRTEGLDDLGEDYLHKMAQSIPLKKLGETEDIAYAAVFLASDEAKFITGQTLVVDGGQILPESLEALD